MPINDNEVRAAALAGLPTWSWGDFSENPPQVANLMRLEPNGWLALIAYLAGPSWVYQEAARYETVGGGQRVGGPADVSASDAVIAEIHDDMVEYLAEAGVPEPPRAVQWMLCLPEGVSEGEINGVCNLAVQDAVPGDLRTQALEMHAALRVLLNGRMPALSW
ncbi:MULTISPECIES: DUF5956 family protein [unclassified Pseudoclavibacter]|uniref:DUF5956 family protein n=1 Tax=unclassified Pseudoclavibacter TaxID=2615177 RepID=UPI001BA728E4|nr:DUF5956 family protein [Pseudoclavibacter sp. Marseille-Q4354]MBS3180405.1 hypothetical protein [Pseudoclavibacter sp. Marseille-Q4354]